MTIYKMAAGAVKEVLRQCEYFNLGPNRYAGRTKNVHARLAVCSPDSRTDEKGPGLHPDEPFAWVECEDVDIAIEVERRLQEDYGHFGDTFGGDQEMSFFVYVYDLGGHFLDD